MQHLGQLSESLVDYLCSASKIGGELPLRLATSCLGELAGLSRWGPVGSA